MSNISSVTRQYHCKVLSTKNVDRLFHCRDKDNCPLNGKCLQTCIVYKADIITNKGSHMIENLSGCSIHKNSFRNRHHEQDTQFSNHIWQLKYKDINFTLKWKIVAYASACRCVSTRCDLCLTEKYVIARADQKNLLNKRPELIANCHHKNKYILKISHNS